MVSTYGADKVRGLYISSSSIETKSLTVGRHVSQYTRVVARIGYWVLGIGLGGLIGTLSTERYH